MSCEQPSFLMDAEVVWIETDAPVIAPAESKFLMTISELAEKFSITRARCASTRARG